MARKVQQPYVVERCPACGASGRTPWGACQACGHYYLAEGWTQVPRRRHPFWWLTLGLGVVVAVLCALITAPFLPDPLTSVFHWPTTQLSSDSRATQWAMWGGDLQQRRYVAEAPRQPEGRRAWSVPLGTPTRSVPVVVDDVIYIGGHFTLLALDAHTGHSRWEIRTTGPVHTSLAVAGEQLYVGLQDWRVLALDRKTGQTRWEFQMQNPVAGSAAVAHGMVYIGSMDGFLYALDAATGKRIWQFKTQEQPLATPALSAGHAFCQLYGGHSLRAACQDRVYQAAFSHSRPFTGLAGRRQRAGVFPRWRSDIRGGSRCA